MREHAGRQVYWSKACVYTGGFLFDSADNNGQHCGYDWIYVGAYSTHQYTPCNRESILLWIINGYVNVWYYIEV